MGFLFSIGKINDSAVSNRQSWRKHPENLNKVRNFKAILWHKDWYIYG